MNDTLPRMVLHQARRLKSETALRRKEEGEYRDISWEKLEENIRLFARGLLALGLRRGERVALMAPNCPEWAYADLGALSCGAISVPVYHTEGLSTLLHIVKDSGSRFLFIHSPLLAEELSGHLDQLPELERVILLEGGTEAPEVLSRKEFEAGAAGIGTDEVDPLLAQGEANDIASIVYTSGTTGLPKGVTLTHRNILSNIEACCRLFDIGERDECLSFLPLSHVLERMAGYYFMLYQGAAIAYAENVDSVPVNLTEAQPTILISVPRLYEKMYARVMERVLSGPWIKKQIFFAALKSCRTLVRKELAGQDPGRLRRLLAETARTTVFAPLRNHLGGRLRFFISGGAPLGREVVEFFMAAGLPIYEGYGLTETSPVIAANSPGAIRLGTVGRPIAGTEVRIAEDGEILVKGPGVFQGYWNNPEATEEAFVDGWFKTGDVGTLDADGFLAITDRKKDLIVTAGGENIAPQHLENRFKSDKFLANAMVYGDRKPYLTALLIPNLENLESYARHRKIDFLDHCDLVNHPQILNLIRRRIDALQEGYPSFQRIKRFTLLSRDFSKDEMTPTLKVKRKLVTERFHKILEEMYLPRDHGLHDSGSCVLEENND
jgi:long-chain acyl-CoA synthetase